MITKGPRNSGQPFYINREGTTSLERVSFNSAEYNEEWIQRFIYSQSAVLPIDEIDSSFSPLIPVGMEVATPAGYIDNLFISPEGYLTIVETKLWKNPEARREVVGQIIDYAKELSKWTYSDLNKAVINSNKKNCDGLLETVRKFNELDEADEKFFIDNVSRNLKRGRFLLLIVGDGIRESVEEMVEYLSQSPQIHFTLALVELQVYKHRDSHIVIPQVVTRTKEVTRAVVRIEGVNLSDLKINVEADLDTTDTKKTGTSARLTITAEDFFTQLEQNTNKELVQFAQEILKVAEETGYFIVWNSGSFSVKLVDPQGSGLKIGLFTVDRHGLLYLGYSQSHLKKLGIPLELSYEYAKDTAKLFPNIQQNPETKSSWNRYSSIADLKPVFPEFMVRVKRYVDQIGEIEQRNDNL